MKGDVIGKYNWDYPYQCKKCEDRFETQSDMQKHIRAHKLESRLDTIIYKKRTIRFPYNVKTGVCVNCGKECQTHLHHIEYHDEDPLKDTIELCPKCHGEWHSENSPNWGKRNL